MTPLILVKMSDSELSDAPASLHNYENKGPELLALILSLSLRGSRQYLLPTATSIIFSKNLFSRPFLKIDPPKVIKYDLFAHKIAVNTRHLHSYY